MLFANETLVSDGHLPLHLSVMLKEASLRVLIIKQTLIKHELGMIQFSCEAELIDLAVKRPSHLLTQLRPVHKSIPIDFTQLVGDDNFFFEEHTGFVLGSVLIFGILCTGLE